MTAACAIKVTFMEPPADLAGYFTTFYHVSIDVTGGGLVRDALQPEWANLRFFKGARPDCRLQNGRSLKDAAFVATGPSSMRLDFGLGTTQFVGIGILPLGWATFLAHPADACANDVADGARSPVFDRFVPLMNRIQACDYGPRGELELAANWFRYEAPRVKRVDRRVPKIHEMIVRPDAPSVSEIAERCGFNTRTLERLCRRFFGFTPSLLLRRQRFMRSIADYMVHGARNWNEAIDRTYFDQSQFVRESHEFLGMSPSQYAAMDHPILASFMRERHRIHGSPVQTLDPPQQPSAI